MNPTAWTALISSLFHAVHSWECTSLPSSARLSRSPSARCAISFARRSPRLSAGGIPFESPSPFSRDSGFPCASSRYITRRFFSSSSVDGQSAPTFQVRDKVQVEVVSFGPLGATVAVVGIGHGPDVNLLPVDAEPYGMGLITQQEIAYYRQSRENVDIVRGEVLPAFVLKIRDEDGKLDLSLRPIGGKAKADDLSTLILDRLKVSPNSVLPIGDKSSPAEISKEFPGVSKAVFKKAVGALYKKGVVMPSSNSIALTKGMKGGNNKERAK